MTTAKGVPFDGKLLNLLISRAGGVNAFLDIWHSRYGETGTAVETPDRSTIYRWMNGAWPRNVKQLCALAHLLDVDPISFLSVSDRSAPNIFATLYRCYESRKWEPPALSFMSGHAGHQRDWPPATASKAPFLRDWRMCEFEHDLSLGTNFYVLLKIHKTCAREGTLPQVFHFAFQHQTLFSRQWLQFGYVIRCSNNVRLVSINGYVETCILEDTKQPTLVETWFGPSPANFRIASLHDFEANLSSETTLEFRRVRFPA